MAFVQCANIVLILPSIHIHWHYHLPIHGIFTGITIYKYIHDTLY